MRRLYLTIFIMTWLVAGLLILFRYLGFGTVEVWDGGFLTAEFRIKFTDESGSPIKGVELVVKNPKGEISYCYPVTDYNKTKKPISDATGVMIFHHINFSPEFGGKCWRHIPHFPLGTCDAPAYTCHFIYLERDIEVIKFSSLYEANQKGESVYELDDKGEKKTILVPWDKGKKVLWEYGEVDESCGNIPRHLSPANRSLPNKVAFPIIKKNIIIRRS